MTYKPQKSRWGESQQKAVQKKYSCWSLSELLTANGRPGRSTANGQISDRWGGRSTGRPTETKTREQLSLSVDRCGRPKKNREQTKFARSAARSADVHTCTACTSVDRTLPELFIRVCYRKGEILVKRSLIKDL